MICFISMHNLNQIDIIHYIAGTSLVAQTVKNLPAGFEPWVRNIPWRRAWQPTPVSLPEEFHGQSSLVGYSP